MRLIELFNLEEGREYSLKPFVKYTTFAKDPEKVAIQFIKELKKVSADWLTETANGDLTVYRGDVRSTNVVVTKVIRTNRKPSDTAKHHHKIANDIFKSMNLTANRSNSVFVSGKFSMASSYASQVWVVIPIGKFSYNWSPKVNDLTFDVFREIIDAEREKVQKSAKHPTDLIDSSIEEITDYYESELALLQSEIDELQAQDNSDPDDEEEAIADFNDMQEEYEHELKNIKPEKWLTNDQIGQIIEAATIAEIGEIKKKHFSKYQGDNGSLDNAISSGNELMISSADGKPLTVFLLNFKFWTNFVKPMMDGEEPKLSNADILGQASW